MPLIIPSAFQNPLAFPAGRAPGFDPTHVASRSCSPNFGFSGIASGGGFVDLLTGRAGTQAGAPAGVCFGGTGPAITFTGVTDAITFTGKNVGAFSSGTIAGIVQFNSIGANYQSVFELNSAGANLGLLALRGVNHVLTIFTVADAPSTILPLAGVPYFLAASLLGGSMINYIVRNLATGALITQVVATGLSFAGTTGGVYKVGNNAAQQTLGGVAAAMFNRTFMSMAELIQWSADPWSFWYPVDDNDERGLSWGGLYGAAPPPGGGLGALLSDKRSFITGGGLIL